MPLSYIRSLMPIRLTSPNKKPISSGSLPKSPASSSLRAGSNPRHRTGNRRRRSLQKRPERLPQTRWQVDPFSTKASIRSTNSRRASSSELSGCVGSTPEFIAAFLRSGSGSICAIDIACSVVMSPPCHAMPCHAMPCHAMPCSKYVVERQELHDKPLPNDCVDVSPAGATMLTVAVAQSATSAEVTLTFATSLSVRIAFVRDQVSH